MKKVLYLINPISGRKNKNKLPELIKKYSDKINPEIRFTEYAGHAIEICKNEHQNYDAIIAVGGDGSVNEIAQSLVHTNTTMGIIPSGSGNGFSNSLGIPENHKKAVQIINNYRTKKIDLVKINDKIFDNVAGIGFDALIAHKFAVAGKRGFISYLKIIIKQLRKYKGVDYKFVLDDDKIIENKSFFLLIANGNQWGNKAQISPSSQLDDGLLNIVILNNFPARAAVPLLIKLYSKKIENSKYIQTFTCKKIVIEKNGKIEAHIDGEPVFFEDKIEIEILPKSLNVIY